MTDPIADMLTRVRNAHMALHKEVSVPRSKMKEAIAAILQQEGYVNDVNVDKEEIKLALKYHKGAPGIMTETYVEQRRTWQGGIQNRSGAFGPD